MSHPSLQPAYMLHQRAYRDTSLLVDFFTKESGRVTAVARGVRAPKSKLKGILQPFVPLLISCSGKTDLLTLCTAEPNGPPCWLVQQQLLSGMYLNELLVRGLHRFDPHPQLYEAYEIALRGLQQSSEIQPVLRQFEKGLLRELGYEIVLDKEFTTGDAIKSDQLYRYEPARGVASCVKSTRDDPMIFVGSSLLALDRGEFASLEQLRDAKRFMRMALAPVLGYQPLKSRELFVK